MGLWLNESMILNPGALEAAAEDLAVAGYGIIRVMLRNTNFTHRSPQVIEAVGRLVAYAHAREMRVALDCEPHPEPVVADLGNLYPDAIGFRVARGECQVVDGRFAMRLVVPDALGTRADMLGIEAAFLCAGGETRKLEEFDFAHRLVVEPYDNGFTRVSHSYREGVPAAHRPVLHLSGVLQGVKQGRLVVYPAFFDPRLIDFWAEGTWRYFDQLLEGYRDIPLDGVSWDEPALGGDWTHYLAGRGFLKAFASLHGYELSPRWHLLDGGMTAEAEKVRLDYYHTLNEGVCEAQRRLVAKARKLWGDHLLLGTHHTWQGEGGINDYRAGAVDYFRLNRESDAGYTDCWWWDYKSCCYAYTLGSSLGRLTPSGEAEVNTWDAKPSNERVEFHARLMTLMDVTWFNIWYGHATDTCLYPADYTWATTVREMAAHRDAQRIIGKAKPSVEIAILHGWETVCAINRADIAAAHKTFCLNVAELCVNRSIAFDWIDDRLLEDSKAEHGRLRNALGNYSILVVPYGSVISPGAWEACRKFAASGGRIVFVATPPHRDTSGNCLEEDFAAMMDMELLPLESYLAELDAICSLPLYRPDELDISVNVPGDSCRRLVSPEGEYHGMRSPEGNVIYLSSLDPRMRLVEFLEQWSHPDVVCHSDSILWRLYRDGDRSLVVCVAKEGLSLRGLIRWMGCEVEFFAGKIALLEFHEGDLAVTGESLEYHLQKRSPEAVAAFDEARLSCNPL